MKERLIFGATSATAEWVARNWATNGDYITIVGRNSTRLAALAKDLQTRGASKVDVAVVDFKDPHAVWKETEEIVRDKPRIDTLLVAHAMVEPGLEERPNLERIENLWRVNLTSTCAILLAAKPHFTRNRFGTMAAISCFSAQMGFANNAIHAAAKGGLDAFLSSLRNEMASYGVHVCSIVPGPIDSPLVKHMPRGEGNWSNPEAVAKAIVAGIETRSTIYSPSAIQWWSLGLRFFPGFVRRRFQL